MKYLFLVLMSFSSFAGIPKANEAKDKSIPIKQNIERLMIKADNAKLEYVIQRTMSYGERRTSINTNNLIAENEVIVKRLIDLGYKIKIIEESYGTYIEISW